LIGKSGTLPYLNGEVSPISDFAVAENHLSDLVEAPGLA
jgi:hypothetical protein